MQRAAAKRSMPSVFHSIENIINSSKAVFVLVQLLNDLAARGV